MTLWHDTAGGVVAVFCHPADGSASLDRLTTTLGHLQSAEMWWHLICRERASHDALRHTLGDRKNALQDAVDELFKDLSGPFATHLSAMDKAMHEYQSAAMAYREMNEAVSEARRAENRLAAFHANLLASVDRLGSNGRAVSQTKLSEAELATRQVQLDLAAVAPLLDTARWASDQHRAQLLNGIAALEQRKTIWFAAIGLVLGILNVWAAATLHVPLSNRMIVFWGIIWPAVLIVGALAAVLYLWHQKRKLADALNVPKTEQNVEQTRSEEDAP